MMGSSAIDYLELSVYTAVPIAAPPSTVRYLAVVNGNLEFWDGTSWTVLGGGGGSATWEILYSQDNTFDVAGGTGFKINGAMANSNDVLTVVADAASSGDAIQISQLGSGKDINGTSSAWYFTKLGALTALSSTLAGTAGSDSFTLTAGDMVLSDGSLTITDADNAATFSVTNNTATSATVFVVAGSGVFTGSTTTSFMTITPSGLTTGTAVYLPVAGMTTGKAVHVVANAVTSGIAVHIASSAASTQLTGAGRLLKVDHTGNATGTGIVAEVNSAAADETVIFKVTASAALALGTALQVSGAAITTGKAMEASDLDALTTGKGLHLASAATAITTTGRIFLADHTGATGTSATLFEFKSAANDETLVLALTAASLTTGSILTVTPTALTTGNGISMTDFAALTSGIALNIVSSATAITGAGRLVYVNHTGATGTSAILNEFASAANDETIIFKVTASAANAAGIALQVATATTTGSGLTVNASALTTGTAIAVTSSGASQTSANVVSIVQSGVTTGFTGSVLQVTGASTTGSGNTVGVIGVNTTTGDTVKVVNNALVAGTSTALLVSHTTSVLGAGNSMVRIASTGVDTGTTMGVLLDLSTTSAAGATQVLLTDSSADTGARIGIYSKVTNTAAVLARPFQSSNVAVSNSKFTKHYVMTDGTKTVTIWLDQDGTDPQGTLSGTAGDMLLNGPSSKIYFCTGTTNWTATT